MEETRIAIARDEEVKEPTENLTVPIAVNTFIAVNACINEEVISVPEKVRKRKTPGRKADPKIRDRKKIVRKHIRHKSDFYDPEIFHALLSELDYDRIPPPIARGKPIFALPTRATDLTKSTVPTGCACRVFFKSVALVGGQRCKS